MKSNLMKFKGVLKPIFQLAGFVACIFLSMADAAQINIAGTRNGDLIIRIDGPLELADSRRFKELINISKAQGQKISFVQLNSPGGAVRSGVEVALIIRDNKLKTVVSDNSVCASACFMLFAAGVIREHHHNSRIGVHSVNMPNLGETIDAKSITVDMVRFLAGLGTPDAVLGRLVRMKPEDMAWLTRDELLLMSKPPVIAGDANDYVEKIAVFSLPKIDARKYVSDSERNESRRLNDLGLKANLLKDKLYYFSKAAVLNPYDAEILTNYGFYLHTNGNPLAAVDVFALSLKLKPRRGSTWGNLGESLSDLGDMQWASECFVNYFEYSSNKQVALNWIHSMINDRTKPTRSDAARLALEVIQRS